MQTVFPLSLSFNFCLDTPLCSPQDTPQVYWIQLYVALGYTPVILDTPLCSPQDTPQVYWILLYAALRIHPSYTGYTFMQPSGYTLGILGTPLSQPSEYTPGMQGILDTPSGYKGYKVNWTHPQDTWYTEYTLRIQGILDTPLCKPQATRFIGYTFRIQGILNTHLEYKVYSIPTQDTRLTRYTRFFVFFLNFCSWIELNDWIGICFLKTSTSSSSKTVYLVNIYLLYGFKKNIRFLLFLRKLYFHDLVDLFII